MLLDYMQDSYTFELEYRTLIEEKIKILGEKFVDKNKYKCKIIYNEKESDLTEYFKNDNKDNHANILKIQLTISKNITDISCMFHECKALLSIKDISNLDNSNTINLNRSFSDYNSNYSLVKSNCSSETGNKSFYDDSIKFSRIHSNTNTSDLTGINDIINNDNIFLKQTFYNVTNMSFMFYGCSSLISLPDISKWDTKNVIYMSSMFSGCSSLISLPDISKWDINNVNYISGMFCRCSSLISLPDISKWKTNNVIYMISMFNGCSSLISLPDISKWNIENVTYMNSMFSGCSSLISLPDLSVWNIQNVIDKSNMFSGCYNLIYIYSKFISLR